MDSAWKLFEKIFTILFVIAFIFFAIEFFSGPFKSNPVMIFLFIGMPILIVIFATIKNWKKKKEA